MTGRTAPAKRRRKSAPGVCDICGCPVIHDFAHRYDGARLVAVRCEAHVFGLNGPPDYTGGCFEGLHAAYAFAMWESFPGTSPRVRTP